MIDENDNEGFQYPAMAYSDVTDDLYTSRTRSPESQCEQDIAHVLICRMGSSTAMLAAWSFGVLAIQCYRNPGGDVGHHRRMPLIMLGKVVHKHT